MNTSLKWIKWIGAAVFIGVLLVALLAGTSLAQGPAPWTRQDGYGQGGYGPGGMMGGAPGMMGGMMGGWGYGRDATPGSTGPAPYGYGSGGMMGGGMMGGAPGVMGGRWGYGSQQPTAGIPVSAEQARDYAQQYLDNYLPGTTVANEADPGQAYGYYTLQVLRDGQVVGMLSVNSVTGQVWYQNWPGNFSGVTGGQEE